MAEVPGMTPNNQELKIYNETVDFENKYNKEKGKLEAKTKDDLGNLKATTETYDLSTSKNKEKNELANEENIDRVYASANHIKFSERKLSEYSPEKWKAFSERIKDSAFGLINGLQSGRVKVMGIENLSFDPMSDVDIVNGKENQLKSILRKFLAADISTFVKWNDAIKGFSSDEIYQDALNCILAYNRGVEGLKNPDLVKIYLELGVKENKKIIYTS